jgi:hypothetical protein
VQTRHEHAELAFVAGRRERGPSHVVLDVEGLVLDPRLERAREEIGVAEL